jgi:hypothetical protein
MVAHKLPDLDLVYKQQAQEYALQLTVVETTLSQQSQELLSLALDASAAGEGVQAASGENVTLDVVPMQGSCSQLCGKKSSTGTAGGFCFCDTACFRTGDCCADHFDLCSSPRLKKQARVLLLQPPASGTIAGWQLWRRAIRRML